jgi:hypothetical protein
MSENALLKNHQDSLTTKVVLSVLNENSSPDSRRQIETCKQSPGPIHVNKQSVIEGSPTNKRKTRLARPNVPASAYLNAAISLNTSLDRSAKEIGTNLTAGKNLEVSPPRTIRSPQLAEGNLVPGKNFEIRPGSPPKTMLPSQSPDDSQEDQEMEGNSQPDASEAYSGRDAPRSRFSFGFRTNGRDPREIVRRPWDLLKRKLANRLSIAVLLLILVRFLFGQTSAYIERLLPYPLSPSYLLAIGNHMV